MGIYSNLALPQLMRAEVVNFFILKQNYSVSSVDGDSPGKNIGVGCRSLLHGIFLTQG